MDRASADRHTPAQLRRALGTWEDEQRGGGKKQMRSVPDVVAYQVRMRSRGPQLRVLTGLQKANKAEFQHLVEAARPKKPAATTTTVEVEEAQVEDPPPSSPVPCSESSEPGLENNSDGAV